MKRLIDAEDLKKEIKSAFSGKIGLTVTSAIHEIIDRQPTIDPENPRPRAYWKNKGEKTYVIWCSNCGEPYYHDFEDFKYCPNCGAKIEDKQTMSYDITLNDPVTKEPIQLDTPHQMQGGTYAVGGTTEAWLNITWNYADWYYRAGVFAPAREESKGIRTIYGMTGAESIPVLQKAIKTLESLTEDISDEKRQQCEAQGATGYWMPTRINAIRPLHQLLALAQMRPDGVWDGD